MKTLALTILLLGNTGLAYAQSSNPASHALRILSQNQFYVYTGFSQQHASTESNSAVPYEVTYVYRDKDEIRCFGDHPEWSVTSLEFSIRGDIQRWVDTDGAHSSGSPDPMLAVAGTVCDTSHNYWTLEIGGTLDTGNAEVSSSDQIEFARLRTYIPQRVGAIEANFFASRHSNEGSSSTSLGAAVGYRREYDFNHWGLDLSASIEEKVSIVPSVSLSWSRKVWGLYLNAMFRADLADSERGTYAEFGVQLPL